MDNEGDEQKHFSSRSGTDDDESDLEYDDLFENVSGDFTKKLNLLRIDGAGPNSQAPSTGSLNWSEKTFRSAENQIRLHLDSNSVDKSAKRNRDRSDRATVEQVLDRRTRLILFRLSQRGVFDSLEGCISTGKEANVYHAVCSSGSGLAVKVYKTSILTFKDRDRYVTGEFRYRHGYARHNPRKMVATWAEKEMRNLQRMHQVGLPVPKAHLLKGHVLVMDFVGENGWPAPLLKNAEFDHVTAEVLYLDCVWMMRNLYRKCRLVHADLSEYNMLYHNGTLFVIDVSQSVEHDHPHSLQFLRSDIINVTKFFNARGSPVLTPQRLFEFITDPTIEKESVANKILDNERLEKLEDNQYLFLHVYIPHKLDNIVHFERDHKMEKEGLEPNNPYQKLVAKVVSKEDVKEEEESVSESSETDSSTEEKEKDERTYKEKHQLHIRYRGESPSTRKTRKMVVPSAAMARSFINPKDRAAEVQRRRQQAETELQRRREERIRQIQEKSENAIKRKQMGLQEKLIRHKTEAEHLREINKRRIEKENQEKQRIQQLVEKKRSSPPRQGSTKPRTTVAFGSRVTHNLDTSKGSSDRSASVNGTLNIMANSLMTRSVHPLMTPAREKPSPRALNTKPSSQKSTSRPSNKPVRPNPSRPTASPRKAPENRMSRSVHPALYPTPNKRVEKFSSTPKPIFPRKAAPVKSKGDNEPKSPKSNFVVERLQSKEGVKVEERSVEVPKLLDLDEPSVQEVPRVEESVFIETPPRAEESVFVEAPPRVEEFVFIEAPPRVEESVFIETPPRAENQKIESIIDLGESPPSNEEVPEVREHQIPPKTEEEIEKQYKPTEFFSVELNGEETPETVPQFEFNHNRSSSDDHDSTRTRTITPHPVFSDDEHDSGVVPETPSPPVSTTDREPVDANHMFLLNSNISSFKRDENGAPPANNIKLPLDDMITHRSSDNNFPLGQKVPTDPEQNTFLAFKTEPPPNEAHTLTNVGSGVILGLTEKQQQERGNRRAKLNEILSRTREQSDTSPPAKTASDSDASVLAKDLLAKRNERFNGSTERSSDDSYPTTSHTLSNGSGQNMMSLAEELENMSLSTKQEIFLLPGQLPDNTNNL